MDLTCIPKDQTAGFPTGVTEVVYATEREMQAFLYGLGYASDLDVETSVAFLRNDYWVVRVRVGDFDDEDELYDEDEQDWKDDGFLSESATQRLAEAYDEDEEDSPAPE